MRRHIAVGALVVVLTACSSTAPETTVEDIEVSGAFGTVPVLDFDPPLRAEGPEVVTVQEGHGPPVESEQPVVLVMSTFSGEDGSVLDGAGEPNVVRVTEDELGPLLSTTLADGTEGSRYLYAEAVDEDGTDTTFVTVVDVMPTRANGEVLADGTDSVTVEMTQDGPVLALSPEATTPGELSITHLVRGDGMQVAPGSRVVAHYTAWTWSDGAVFDSTWQESPAVITLEDALPGLRDGLVDARVGSRVLLLVPPAEGIGTDALVLVIDVLAVSG